MEAAPRLPMISFELKVSTENVSFGPKLKQYIAGFYHEDPESYNNEIHSLETLRAAAVRPAVDVTGCQTLKQYYCQIKFLKSRFPMEKGQPCAVSFAWKDLYSGVSCSLPDVNFELNCILHNIGALHTQLGAADTRSSSEGMKMSCTHFQCAAWAFQHLKENYSQMVTVALLPEVIHFMQQLCLAQAQECILEKSMLDNRKSTIIAKVAVQVVDYYNGAMQTLTASNEYSTLADVVGSRVLKDWNRYLKFKIAYHSSISLLYQGQQAEEAQKMGERVAYYQAASEQLEEARKIAKGHMEVDEALAFTQDVVEGKKKAAKNENEFIYHEVVPEKDALQQVNGASLVKGTPFSVNDPEVSGKDLFCRLVPMEAHEASSLYSEQKAEMLRQIGAIVETKDAELVEFMSSLQLDCLNQWRQAIGVPQDIVDRAAAICAKPQATQALVEVMGKLSATCHEVESLLSEIQELITEEESKEQEYQKIMGNRPPGIVSTDLSREAGKYSEAHSKANESNQTLHRAMTMHMSNLKILAQPLSELKKAIPGAVSGDPSVDETVINDLETLIAKVDEMRAQRANLVSQLREAVFADDITAMLVTKPPDISMEQLFQKELTKHKMQASLIEQNLAAQDNILSALTDVYAKFASTRRYMLDVVKRREVTSSALIASYDAYDDLLAKANKGIEFYQKLEGNVAKLLQRVKSACKVNEEEREQMLAKSTSTSTSTNTNTPKLKDYLANMPDVPTWVPAVRPTPLGQEETKQDVPSYHYPTHYYPPTHYPEISNYYQSYPEQYPTNYYNYQLPPTSYTPSATSQMNYSSPGIYSPSTDTSAPSQKALNNYGYETIEKPVEVVPINPINYTYPTNYQIPGNYYNAPNDEYQQQYQYIPQYYPTSIPQPPEPIQTPQNDPTNQNYYSSPYGYQTMGMNPMTMMQANNNSTATNTISSSNVDLLTGLDFSVSQAPLLPVNVPVTTNSEPKVEPKKEVIQEKPIVEPEKENTETPIQDPLSDTETYNSFSQEVDKLEKFVDTLTTKTLNGPTPLDIKWKEIQEQQDRDAQKYSISVARCYPMKNRFPDIMPYDHSRVELPSTKDDYINASFVKGISLYVPPFIVTQAPLKSTLDDFWTMVWEQQIEVVVCLLGDAEIQQEGTIYWPPERGSDLQIGKFKLVLQGINHHDNLIERIISIGEGNKHLIVVHIQFTGWPGGGLFPTTVFPLISLANTVLACHRQQRVKNRPILVHCLSGIGRSGVLCALIAAICDPLRNLDVGAVASRMTQSRKNILRDREHLKFTYQAVLQHFKDLLSGKQLQAKMQNVNIAANDSLDRQPIVSLEASNDPIKQRKKFTRESFEALKEQGITPVSDTSDPLSSLDPLWTIRK